MVRAGAENRLSGRNGKPARSDTDDMAVVASRPGQPYNPKTVSEDLARINALGYFADIAPPLVRARPGGIAITYRVVENPVISKIVFTGNQKVPSDTLLALMDLGRPSIQHEHLSPGRPQDQQLLRAHRIRRAGTDPRQGHQPRLSDRSPDAHDPGRLDRKGDRARRRSAASASADPSGAHPEGRQRLFRCRARRRL